MRTTYTQEELVDREVELFHNSLGWRELLTLKDGSKVERVHYSDGTVAVAERKNQFSGWEFVGSFKMGYYRPYELDPRTNGWIANLGPKVESHKRNQEVIQALPQKLRDFLNV